MAKKIRWGIMGCGRIANDYANDLTLTKYGELVAVGSRSKAKAKKFAAQHVGARAYGSYEELAADPDVDIVYVATPHPYHMENTLLAIKNGKHVLCEKPMAMNAKQTRRMIAAAQKKGVFLMEAMWTRFFPAIIQLRQMAHRRNTHRQGTGPRSRFRHSFQGRARTSYFQSRPRRRSPAGFGHLSHLIRVNGVRRPTEKNRLHRPQSKNRRR